jgi:hypothetical protein
MRLSRTALFSSARWLAFLIPLADLALVLSGVLDARTGLVVGLALEVLLTAVVVVEAQAFRAAYRRGRANGRTRAEAAVLGVEAAWPPVVLRLARAEIGLLRGLWWAVRGRRAVAPGEVPLQYADRFTVMVWAVCCLGVLELGVVHVLTGRWPAVQWTLFALGCYALLWVIGFGLSLRQHPHVLRDGEIVLRFGHIRSVRVPVDRLVAVRTGAVSGHKRNLVIEDDGMVLAVMGDTNVDLRFDPAVDVEVGGLTRSSSRISFYADDPRGAARLLRALDASASG